MSDQPIFDHEKLDVYQVELGFVGWATDLLSEIKSTPQSFQREVCDQLDRASLSALLNTAEGNGKRQGRQRAKFFDDARGSATTMSNRSRSRPSFSFSSSIFCTLGERG